MHRLIETAGATFEFCAYLTVDWWIWQTANFPIDCTWRQCSAECTMKCIYPKYAAEAYELDAVVWSVHYICEEKRIISGYYNGKMGLIADRQQRHKQNTPNRFQRNGCM